MLRDIINTTNFPEYCKTAPNHRSLTLTSNLKIHRYFYHFVGHDAAMTPLDLNTSHTIVHELNALQKTFNTI